MLQALRALHYTRSQIGSSVRDQSQGKELGVSLIQFSRMSQNAPNAMARHVDAAGDDGAEGAAPEQITAGGAVGAADVMGAESAAAGLTAPEGAGGAVSAGAERSRRGSARTREHAGGPDRCSRRADCGRSPHGPEPRGAGGPGRPVAHP